MGGKMMDTMLLELSEIKPSTDLLSKVLKVIHRHDPELNWPISKWYLLQVTVYTLEHISKMITMMIQYYTWAAR